MIFHRHLPKLGSVRSSKERSVADLSVFRGRRKCAHSDMQPPITSLDPVRSPQALTIDCGGVDLEGLRWVRFSQDCPLVVQAGISSC